MTGLVRPLLVLFAALTALTGIVYPLVVTGIGRLAFPAEVEGSLIRRGDVVVGSTLIGQPFADPKYFWGRLSATAPMPYDGLASGGSNYGSTNPALIDAVKARIAALTSADPGNPLRIPVDLVTASGSGLDPHISPAAALYQVARVARARHLDPMLLRRRVLAAVEPRSWHLFGEPVVNVLALNLALDSEQPSRGAQSPPQ